MLPPGVCLSTLVLRVSLWKEAEISGATEIENHSCLLPVIFSVLFYKTYSRFIAPEEIWLMISTTAASPYCLFSKNA